MTPDFDPRGDLVRVADGLEAVSVAPAAGTPASEVPHALRRAVTTAEAEKAGGQVTAADVVWHLPAAELPDPPAPGHLVLEPDGRRWTVLQVQQATFDGRWRCLARDLAVAHHLDDTVDVQEAVYTKGTGGAVVTNWQTWRTGLKARIQPALVEADDQHRRQITGSLYLIYLEENLAVARNHRVVGPGGTVYRITASRKAQRIDAVMEIDAVRVGS